ncbi:ABC transporter transmembrane domain-containing protein [Streptomyces sp. BK239]|uniref:ABC transporter transmembrane domain-containing protein n=1 Tax=Streptomyces sp. BK239 TaxID=2512155 RepID=UPI0010D06135|nr:ABC transporter transmembrane domain-containing protein [Streptomyces sp. BK239]RZU18135.1 ABC transporter transmembrane protein [Streptomyces sp. BK239]
MLTSLLHYARPGPLALLASVAAGVGVSACYVGQSLLLTLAVARGLRHDLTGAVWACCGALALVAVRAVLVRAREVAAARAAERVRTDLRLRLYRHLLTLGPAHVTRQRTGAVLTTLQDSVDRFVSVFLPQVLVSVVGRLGIVAVLGVIGPPVAALVAVTAVVAAAAPRLLRRRMRRMLTDCMRGWRALSADYLDAVQGLPTLKAVGADEHFGTRLSRSAWDFYRSSLRFTQIPCAVR